MVFFQNGKTEYNYVDFLTNIVTTLFLIAQSNLTYSFLSYISTSNWNNAQVLARFFSQQLPGLSNWCMFAFGHPTVWEICTRYWVRSEYFLDFALLGSSCGTSSHRWIRVLYLSRSLFLTQVVVRVGTSSPFWFTLCYIQVFLVTSWPWLP